MCRDSISAGRIAWFLARCKHIVAGGGKFDKMLDIYIPFCGFIIREQSKPMIGAAGYCRRPVAGGGRGA